MSSISTAMSKGSSARPTAVTGMASGLAEDLHQQVGTPVDHGRGLVEAGSNIDHAEYLDDALDAIEVAQLGVQRGQNGQPGEAGSPATVFEGDVAAHLPADNGPSTDRSVAAHIDQAVLDHATEVVARQEGRPEEGRSRAPRVGQRSPRNDRRCASSTSSNASTEGHQRHRHADQAEACQGGEPSRRGPACQPPMITDRWAPSR